MSQSPKLYLINLILITLVAASIIAPALAAEAPKPLEKIIYYAFSDDTKGLLALQKGDIDIYVPSKPLSDEAVSYTHLTLPTTERV